MTDSLGPDRTLTYLKSNLPEFYKASAFELALGSAGLLSLPTVRQVVADLSEDDRTGVLNNFCLDHCRKHDWRSARAAVDIIPDRWRYKPWILGLIAEEALRSRARVDAMNLVTQALKLCRSFVPQEVVGGYAQIGTVYVKLGRLDLAAELLREAPDPAQRKILLELATRTAEAGPPDSVLAIFRRAQKLPPEFPITRNPDQGLEQWIEAMADSGHDMIALQAADGLLFGPDRGWARSLVALSQIRRGLLAEAERTVNLIEQNPFRLADALVELAIAQAAAGDVVGALRMVDRIAPDATAMCEYPIEQVPVVCPDPISCPPVGHIFRSRMKALREIGATAAGRVAVDSLVAERSAAESAALLIGAVSGLSRH